MEITNDIQFLLLVMVAILSAKVLGDYITHPLYHALLEMKCIPFLDNELHLHDEHHKMLDSILNLKHKLMSYSRQITIMMGLFY